MNPVALESLRAASGELALMVPPFLADLSKRLNIRVVLYTAFFGWLFSVISYVGFLADPLRDHSFHFYLILHVPINVGAAFFLLLAFVCGDSLVAFGARPVPAYLVTLVSAALLFAWLQWELRHWFGVDTSVDRDGFPVAVRRTQMWFMALGVLSTAGTIAFVYVNRQRAVLSLRQLQAARLERAEIEKTIVGSRLQAMQARVEPQLLSDTLHCVRRLYESDPKSADGLLDDLIQYLRAALPQLRSSASTLGREFKLAAAHVNILATLHDDGTACEAELPAELEATSLAPMLLLPMTAHAMRLIADVNVPARIHLRADVAGGSHRVLIEFAMPEGIGDDSMQPPVEVSERLRALYDSGASLAFERMPSHRGRYVLQWPISANAQ